MKLDFWILSIVCIFCATSTIAEDAQAIVEGVNKAIHTVFQVVDLYNGVDKHLPVAEFKDILPDFEEHTIDYSVKSASLVGEIKTNIMNAIDAYFQASRHISEWSSLMKPLLKAYLTLFSDFNSAKAKAQIGLLRKLLDEGVVRTKEAQRELERITKNLNDADRTLYRLSLQLESEYDEGSPIFQKRLIRMNRKSSIGDRIVDTITDNKEDKAELKGRLALNHDLNKKLADLVGKSLVNIEEFQVEMKTKIEYLKEESSALSNYGSVIDNPELLKSTVKATEDLINKCNDYVEKHKLFTSGN